jgi:2-polyprenyl-3-methyl-5-hydroxy-6-metoxy-1,4-benzoquinol methylase
MAGSERVVDHRGHMSDSTHDAGALGAYTGARPEVQALVPRSARRVLDLGCASGALGAGLKARGGVEVVGVELDPAHVREAERWLDRVVAGDLEELLLAGDVAERLGGGRFDCIVAADVLEHLRDPWAALRGAVRALLAPGGVVVVSLPNVRFFETFWQLGVRGTWPRRSFGIFDSTHLRWFALRDARALLEDAGLRVEEVRPLIRVRPGGSRFDRLFGWLARTPLAGFFAFQYVLVGVGAGAPLAARAQGQALPD